MSAVSVSTLRTLGSARGGAEVPRAEGEFPAPDWRQGAAGTSSRRNDAVPSTREAVPWAVTSGLSGGFAGAGNFTGERRKGGRGTSAGLPCSGEGRSGTRRSKIRGSNTPGAYKSLFKRRSWRRHPDARERPMRLRCVKNTCLIV